LNFGFEISVMPHISYPLLLASIFFAGIGLLLIRYPHVIRRYDTRLTRQIKDEGEYIVVCRIFGFIFVFISLVPLILAIVPGLTDRLNSR
jgi:hypothetical protein